MARKPLSDEARKARNEYRRKWYAENKDKAQAQQARYWERRASEMLRQANELVKVQEAANV